VKPSKQERQAYERWKRDVPPPTDGQMKQLLVERLHRDNRTEAEEITVDVAQGVAVLGGSVSDARVKDAASREAWATPGVVDVKNELRVVRDEDA